MGIRIEMFPETETPNVLVDFDVAERNVRKFQEYCDLHQIRARPHIKTHKLEAFAKLQIVTGAVGINCQKLSEAEAFLDLEEIRDVLITYNIVGKHKLKRLKRLSKRFFLTLVADNSFVVNNLSKTFQNSAQLQNVMVECDTGAGRCGVQSPGQACELALEIDRSPGLHFKGLMTFPPSGRLEKVSRWLTQAKSLCMRAGLEVETISSGGSPDMYHSHEMPIVNEYRAGTYIYNDRSLVEYGSCRWEDCALTVLATVVSVPTGTRAIVDAGSKVMTSDTLGLNGYGHVLNRPDIAVDQLSEEHGRLVADKDIGLNVGDRVRIVPNHACVVANMLDEVVEVRGKLVRGTHRVIARGKVW